MERTVKRSSLGATDEVFELRNLVGPLRYLSRYEVSLSPDNPRPSEARREEEGSLGLGTTTQEAVRLIISGESKETPRIEPTPAKFNGQNGNKWKKRKIMTTNFKNKINEGIDDILKGLELFAQNRVQHKGIVVEKKCCLPPMMKKPQMDLETPLKEVSRNEERRELLEAEDRVQKQLSLNEDDLKRKIETKERLEFALRQKRREIEDLDRQKIAIEKELLEMTRFKKEKEGEISQYLSSKNFELDSVNQEKERMRLLLDRLRVEYTQSEETRQNMVNALLEISTQPMTICRLYSSKRLGAASGLVSSDATNTLRLLPHGEHRVDPAKHLYIFNRLYDQNSSSAEISEALLEYLSTVLEGTNTSLISISAEPIETIGSPSRKQARFQNQLSLHLADWIVRTVQARRKLSESKERSDVFISCVGIVNEKLHDLLVLDYKFYESAPPKCDKGKGEWEKASLHAITGPASTESLLSEAYETYSELLDDHIAQNCLHQVVLRLAVPKPSCSAGYTYLTLVDIAGIGCEDRPGSPCSDPLLQRKERQSKKQASASRNRPLTTLQRVIRGLRRQKGQGGKEEALPFRECLLTRLLQECMGPKTQSVVLANVDVASDSLGKIQMVIAAAGLGNP
jgi:hypothetical protein